MFSRLLRFSAGVLFTAAALSAADCSGIWTGQMPDRNGDLEDYSFRFAQQGETLTGKMYGLNESTPISEGTVSGDRISFTVTNELNGQISKVRFTGTVTGAEMHVIRERVATGGGAGANKGSGRPALKQELTLKRMT